MKIFDGVEVTPPPNSTMQTVLSIAMLIANSYVEADKFRKERVAAENRNGPETLDEVMAQAGLKIPGLEEALAKLVGSEEGKRVASMIVNSPDPVSLLRAVAMQFGQTEAGMEAPAAGPAARDAGPPTTTPVSPANSGQAAHAPPTVPLAKFRPEFMPEAAKAKETRPVTAPRTTLVGVVKQQLQSLRTRMNAHANRTNERLTRAEAQLAEMQQQLAEQQRSRPVLVVVPQADEPQVDSLAEAPAQAPAMPAESVVPSSPASPADSVVPSSPAVPTESVAPSSTVVTSASIKPPAEMASRILDDLGVAPVEAALPAATEHEVVEAMGLIAEFTSEVEAQQQREAERLTALESQIHHVQAVIAVRAPDPVAAHG